MKILFVFTGGTIGSTLDGNYISVDAKKPYLLLERYAENEKLPDFDTAEPYTALSEHNTGSELSALIACVRENISSYDGIIITHGTDTLQYTAAALSYAFGSCTPPICLVSSNFPIEHPQANGLANLRAAIAFIRQGGGNGVFVMYQNQTDARVSVHRGTRLLESQAFSDAVFSVHNCPFGWISSENARFLPNPTYHESPDAVKPFAVTDLPASCPQILRIVPYVGFQYPSISQEIRYILHESYHSGTINTRTESARAFFVDAKCRKIPVFLTGVSGGASYASAKDFTELSILPLPPITPIAAFLKLWFCAETGADAKKIMFLPLGGDF